MLRSKLLPLTLLLASACAEPSYAAGEVPAPKVDLPASPAGQKAVAVLAAGCFWCVESIFERLEGVITVESGYAGGSAGDANYQKVSAHQTKHAEAVRITYDPSKISYGTLLRVFFATQDPTLLDRQGPDSGHQYRSAIFVKDDQEKKVAEAYIAQLDAAKIFPRKIVTTIEPMGEGFFPAEEYHQDFVVRNPNHPYVRSESLPRANRVDTLFPTLIKKKS